MSEKCDIASQLRDVEVSVFHTEGCQSTPAAIQAIESIAAQAGVSVHLRTVLIDSAEDASHHRFLGSPTIHVNGRDIDPSARPSETYGLT
jgi:hypothetical protein